MSRDLVCVTCRSPWSADYVLHDEPEEFKRRGGVVSSCPACKGARQELTPEEDEKSMMARAMADIMGDDIDGFINELEDNDLY